MRHSSRATDLHARRHRAEHILDVAADLLLRWGYNRVTIDDVATYASVGKGTIYLHWNSREALFSCVLMRETAMAIDELVAALREVPSVALFHRLMHTWYLIVMHRPLVRALFVADLEILGKLAKSADKRIEAQRDVALHAYLALLVEHGLVRDDVAMEELRYTVRALVSGFYLAEVFPDEAPPLTLERKAALLATSVRRVFETEEPPHQDAIEAIASQLIALYTDIAGRYRAHVHQAYTKTSNHPQGEPTPHTHTPGRIKNEASKIAMSALVSSARGSDGR